jgi:hypothetical protein
MGSFITPSTSGNIDETVFKQVRLSSPHWNVEEKVKFKNKYRDKEKNPKEYPQQLVVVTKFTKTPRMRRAYSMGAAEVRQHQQGMAKGSDQEAEWKYLPFANDSTKSSKRQGCNRKKWHYCRGHRSPKIQCLSRLWAPASK